MAAPPLRRLTWRIAKWSAFALAAFFALFFLSIWIGSSIPRNSGWREPDDGIEIMVQSNGVHTALVLPLVTPERDWRPVFPADEVALSGEPYTHLAISWGERQVFLETPTWWDLSPMTVLRIAGIGGDGLLHVEHYVRPAPADDLRPLRLTHAEYARLVAEIDRVVPQGQRVSYPGYGDQDVFYETGGHYTVRNTCNQWTSNTLASAGVKTGWWTPMAGGVMKWVPDSAE
ncbi:DUF2459 domain-containing protein [Croceibacterium salegens]